MIKINDIVSNPLWEAMQDAICNTTKFAIISINYDGTPVTKHSACSGFCQKVRSNPKLAKLCEQCDARAGYEALRANKPFIYHCHLGIVDIAVPIIVEHQYLGSLMAGQVRLAPGGNEAQLVQLLGYDKIVPEHSLPDSLAIEGLDPNWKEDYEKLPVLTYEEILAHTEMLKTLCDYVSQEKNKSLREIKQIKQLSNKAAVDKSDENDVPSMESVLKTQRATVYTNGQYKFFSDPLKNAIDFILSNPDHYPSLVECAKECSISPSYLSRMFSSELKVSYSSFIAKIKMEQAKNLLENTNLSINEIGSSLEYEDSGYFIKVFKKYTNTTPFNYRKIMRAKD